MAVINSNSFDNSTSPFYALNNSRVIASGGSMLLSPPGDWTATAGWYVPGMAPGTYSLSVTMRAQSGGTVSVIVFNNSPTSGYVQLATQEHSQTTAGTYSVTFTVPSASDGVDIQFIVSKADPSPYSNPARIDNFSLESGSVVTPPPTLPTGTVFYVAPNGNDNWSGTLAAPNGNFTDGPFATILKARDAMRANPNVRTTFLRTGEYYLTSPITLDSRDNGVTFRCVEKETPHIIAATKLTGWTDEGGGIFSKSVTGPTGLDLFIGFSRQRCAQSGTWDPNDPIKSGWFICPTDGTTTTVKYTGTDVTSADLTPSTWIQTFDRERLSDGLVQISAIDTTTKTITLATPVQYATRQGGTFRLMNRSSYVKNTGEFAWRTADSRLVIKPVNPANFEVDGVHLPVLDNMITIDGGTGITLAGLFFHFNTWNGTAVNVRNSTQITMNDNVFEWVGQAIYISNVTASNFEHNTIQHTARHAIYMDGGSNNLNVIGNIIGNVGEVKKDVAGIGGNGIHDVTIRYNEIITSARYGISIKDWNANNANYNIKVEYNFVSNCLRETADGACIEMLGRSNNATNNIIKGNFVSGAPGIATNSSGNWLENYKGFGIYMDDMTNNVTITGNLIKNVSWACVFLHGGDNNVVTNNFGIISNETEQFIRIENVPSGGTIGTPANNNIHHNIIYSDAGSLLTDYWTLFTPGTYTIASNLVYNVGRFTNGTDTTGDPKFLRPEDENYALSASSPAFALGIADLEWNKMGLPGYEAPPPITSTVIYYNDFGADILPWDKQGGVTISRDPSGALKAVHTNSLSFIRWYQPKIARDWNLKFSGLYRSAQAIKVQVFEANTWRTIGEASFPASTDYTEFDVWFTAPSSNLIELQVGSTSPNQTIYYDWLKLSKEDPPVVSPPPVTPPPPPVTPPPPPPPLPPPPPGCLDPAPSAITRTGLIFEAPMNSSGFMTPTTGTLQTDGDGSITFEAVGSENAVKFVLNHSTAITNPRAELIVKGVAGWTQSGQCAVMGQDYFYGVRGYLGADYGTLDSTEETIMQFKDYPDVGEDPGRGPMVDLTIKNISGVNKFVVTVRNDSKATTPAGGGDNAYGKYDSVTQYILAGNVSDYVSKWVDWVWYVKWNYQTNQGKLYLWRDQKLVLWLTSTGVGYNDQNGPYLKVGINKPAWSSATATGATTRTFYAHDLRVAPGANGYNVAVPTQRYTEPTIAQPDPCDAYLAPTVSPVIALPPPPPPPPPVTPPPPPPGTGSDGFLYGKDLLGGDLRWVGNVYITPVNARFYNSCIRFEGGHVRRLVPAISGDFTVDGIVRVDAITTTLQGFHRAPNNDMNVQVTANDGFWQVWDGTNNYTSTVKIVPGKWTRYRLSRVSGMVGLLVQGQLVLTFPSTKTFATGEWAWGATGSSYQYAMWGNGNDLNIYAGIGVLTNYNPVDISYVGRNRMFPSMVNSVD